VVGDSLGAGVADSPGLTPEIWLYRDDLTQAEEVLRRGQEAPDEQDADESES
jgi:hypothetical protein